MSVKDGVCLDMRRDVRQDGAMTTIVTRADGSDPLSKILNIHPELLADIAEVARPAEPDSTAAIFLAQVQNRVVQALARWADDHEALDEKAGGPQWALIAAEVAGYWAPRYWQFRPAERASYVGDQDLVLSSSDSVLAAFAPLYVIAERLASALARRMADEAIRAARRAEEAARERVAELAAARAAAKGGDA